VLISCWSVKGGAGTTVVASALAFVLARSAGAGSLLVDLAGDVPAAVGVADPGDPGLSGWTAAGAGVPPDGLARLELDLGSGVSLLPRGRGRLGPPDRMEALGGLLAADHRPVVADCGLLDDDAAALPVAAVATQSLLVIRPCYLALRRVVAAPIRPSGIVLVVEPGRALTRHDVENIVGAPVRAEIACDPAIARTVDAGVLASKMPRPLERALRGLTLPLAA
jgi:hypothetical protein